MFIMPKIQKVRIANAKIDSGVKIIPDNGWDLNGDNSLFLLENGGGKTTVIQIIHQMAIPNSRIQGRSIAESLEKGSTLHAAVEWIHDDEDRSNFITGFTFFNHGKKRTPKSRPYDYLSYVYSLDEKSPTLDELPFFNYLGNVTPLFELERELKNKPGILCFLNKPGEYIQEIENYGIFKSEWENIAKVNGDEGGVQGFFDKSKTTHTLLSNMLIPSLEDSLYDADDKDEIVNTFKKLQKTFLSIPELERNIKDFNVITEKSEDIIRSVENFKNADTETKRQRGKLSNFYKTVHHNHKQIIKKKDQLEMELQNLLEQEKDLNYKLDSYKIHTEEMKKEKLVSDIEEIKEEIKKKERDVKFYKEKIDEQNGIRHFKRYIQHRSRKVVAETSLEAMQMNRDEQEEKYDEMLQVVSHQNAKISHEKSDKVNSKYKTVEALKEKLDSNRKKEGELNKGLNQTSNKLGSIQAKISDYEDSVKALREKSGEYWDVDQILATEKVTKKVIGLKESITQFNKNKEQLANGSNKAQIKKQEIKMNLRDFKEMLKQEKENIESFEEKKRQLINNISIFIRLGVSDLFGEKDRINQRLQIELKNLENNVIYHSLELNNLSAEEDFLATDGYIVHPELRKMKNWLLEKNIDLVLGTEYLYTLQVSREEKQKMIEANPLVSFSFLIEESDMGRLRTALRSFKENLTVPIFFMNRSSLSNLGEQEILFRVGKDLLVHQQLEKRLEENDWRNYQNEILEKKEEVENQKKIATDEIEKLRFLQQELGGFYKQFDSETPSRLRERITVLTNNIKDTNGLIVEKKEAIKEFDGKSIAIKNEIDKVTNHLFQMEELKRDFQSFIDKFSNIKEVKEEMIILDHTMQSKQKSLRNISVENDNINRKLELEQKGINTLEIDIKLLDNDKEICNLITVEYDGETDVGNYEENKVTLKVYQKGINESEEQRNRYNQEIKEQTELMDDRTKEINKLGYQLSYFEGKSITYDERLLESYEEHLDIESDEHQLLVDNKNKLNADHQSANDLIVHLIDRLKENYNKEFPYHYDELNAEEEKREYEETLSRTKFEIVRVRQEQAKISDNIIEYENTLYSFNVIKEDLHPLELSTLLSDDLWKKDKPLETYHRLERSYTESIELLKESDRTVDAEIQFLMDQVSKTGNQTLMNMSEKFKLNLVEGKKNPNKLISYFIELLDAVEGYKKLDKITAEEAEEDKLSLIDSMIKRSEVLYENIRSLEQSSTINVDGEAVKTILVRWPRESEEDIKYNFKTFLDRTIFDLELMNQRGMEDNELDAYIDRELKMINIIDSFARVDKCDIRVLKPRNKIIKIKEYEVWEKAASWSGGERHSFRMTMFIAINNLLRKKKMSQEGTSKVLVVDNPFGEASSEHVIEPMIELANSTNTQLFCFTDIQNENILNNFETIISNRYIDLYGSVALASEVKHKNNKEGSADLESLSFYMRRT